MLSQITRRPPNSLKTYKALQHLLTYVYFISSENASKRRKILVGNIVHRTYFPQFDDIELAVPFAPITKYSNFTLSGFSLMNVPLAYKNGSLAADDINCATSPPNALKGSRSNPSVWPRIAVSAGFPGTYSTSKAKSFRLLGMSAKALGVVPKYLSVIFQGWVIENGRAIDSAYLSATYLSEGPKAVMRVNFTYWASWQKNITVVEVWAETQEKEDWEFCVDDVLIVFTEG